ncbi:LLM class oxidoreductase [Noviherbaspirillum suwonense]|jgi:luciferase-type oxidoreductase|uniref:Luciferase-type oxidoreductase, BA3436 family n=1 Tax=Noviherbaspirillum suwonense TaxID=1224511 RepID=A0ABY1QUY7_9BURK|nr:LLM class oxidoreductase [Noviherbaspirillum suwonense]SMP81631.1 luciferase-type oxidoreductase, BA3436 family [Noviherbaspirillum suwonense]
MATNSMLSLNTSTDPSNMKGFRRMFAPGRLTLGVFFPIEAFEGDQPSMQYQEDLARRAEELGFAALWFRDVPLRDPSFGDIGQVFDPWVYLGWIAAQTREIALATGSIILPLRHPLHTAKAAASVDQLSGGRLVLGLASGDRPVEFPAFGVDFEQRSALFRENLRVIRTVLNGEFPSLHSSYGQLYGSADLVPKPMGRLPMLVTGHSGQRLEWIAQHADGWITYPRGIERQMEVASRWRAAVEAAAPGAFKPFVQSFYLDLSDNPEQPPTPIHLGFRGGRSFVLRFLEALHGIGVNHVILNLKYGARDAGAVLEEIGNQVLPQLEASMAAAASSSP